MSDLSHTPQIRSYLEGNLPHFLDLLREMVAINSFTANRFGVDELGVLTAQRFGEMGFVAETVPSENALYGRHLILTRHGSSVDGAPPPRLGLVSHLDTVFPPDEEARNDFRWRPEGERIYGPGTVDIKGGTVMIYMILSVLRDHFPELFEAITWVVLLDATEETGGADFGRLVVQHLSENPLACLVFEPGNWRPEGFYIVVARKGMATYRIEVEGRAAHAGSAHEHGANAIVQIADVLRRVAGLTDYERNLTFNVGTVAGGTVINRVPHFASASVEMRAFEQAVYEEAMARMLAFKDYASIGAANGGYNCRVMVKVHNKVLPWPRNGGTDSLFAVWAQTAAELGFTAIPEERAGLSDGNYFWSELPTLDGLGPAGANAHCSERSPDGGKDQEYVLATSFVPKALLNTMAIIKLINQKTASLGSHYD